MSIKILKLKHKKQVKVKHKMHVKYEVECIFPCGMGLESNQRAIGYP